MKGAIDLGGTKTMIAILEDGKIIDKFKFSTYVRSWEENFKKCCKELEKLCKRRGIVPHELEGIGVSLPGMTDVERGKLIYAPFSKWKDVPVVEWFEAALNNPKVYVENDVNACAIGELLYGYGKTYKDYLWITLSTGIGGAIVANGKLLRGGGGLAGEFGHLKVERNQPEFCPCGQKGCLEAQASGTAIKKNFRRYVESRNDIKRELIKENIPMDAYGCKVLAMRGDKQCIEIYNRASEYIGRGIAYALNILNPQAVILGGGVANSIDILLPGIMKVIKEEVVVQAQNVKVLYTELGYEAALIGAGALVDVNQKYQKEIKNEKKNI